MKPVVRHTVRIAALILVGTMLYCEQPIEPDSADRPRGIEASAETQVQPPEEEILGSVFSGAVEIPSTSREYSVRLTPVGSGACIFRANASSTCLASSTIPVMPNGSRAGSTKKSPMWGWFNNLDPDNNPCNPNIADKAEWHDLNHNGVRDDGSVEQHCIKPGRYKVEVRRQSSVIPTRVVDHFRVSGTLNLKGIENPAGTSANDTYVHTEVSTTVPLSNNVLAIDNPETGTAFASGDTVVHAGVPVRFDSRATTTWSVPVPGRLMNRVYFDLDFSTLDRTEHWNPDLVMRTRSYSLSSAQQTFRTRTEIATPSDPTGDTNRNSPERRVVVQSAVAMVTVSPSSATITTQNGTVSLTATLRDAAGNVLTGRPISWSSSNTTVATVSGSGNSATVTGKMNGTASIIATSEGRSGTATITVSIGTDNASGAGNTLPTSFENGSAVSVSVSMQNTGGSTWTSTAGYALDLSRDGTVWAVTPPSVGTAGVAPGTTKSFAFTLRTDDPTRRGLTACFFQMARNGSFFGAENGKDINITGPKLLSGGAQALSTEGVASLAFDPGALWLQDAADEGSTRIPLDAAAFRQTDTVSLSYAYAHEVPRSIDVVFKYSYDPAVFEPMPVEVGLAGVTIQAGLAAPGEYWIRFTGDVPEGDGLIAGLPFRLLPGAKAPRESTATLTVYQLPS